MRNESEFEASKQSQLKMVPLSASLMSCKSPLDDKAEKVVMKLMRDRASALFFDLYVPQNETELRKFNSMALLALRYFSPTRDDFPLEKAHLLLSSDRTKVFLLPQVFPQFPVFDLTKTENYAPARAWNYRSDAFFFVPLEKLLIEGEVFLRVSGNNPVLKVLSLPVPRKGLLASRKKFAIPDANRFPDPATLLSVIRSRYCFQ